MVLESTEHAYRFGSQNGCLSYIYYSNNRYGLSFESFIVARTIIKHCDDNKLLCLNLAKNLNLKYEDFYDESHLNIIGSKKIAEYIYSKIPIF